MLEKFASILFDPEDIVELRCTPKNRGGGEYAQQFWVMAEDIPDMSRKLSHLNKQGRNVFVGVLPRTGEGGGDDVDCLPGRVVWADIEDIAPDKALRRLERLGIPSPTMALNSGGGIHAYWKLDAKAYPEDLKIAVYSLAKHVLGDAKVFNPSRVMRLPGFVNTKYEDSVRICEIIHFEPSNVYALADLTSKYPAVRLPGLTGERKLPEGTKTPPERVDVLKRAFSYLEAVPGVAQGDGQNNKAHELAKRLRDKGLDLDEVYLALRDTWNPKCAPAMDLQELYSCVENGFKYARKDAGCEPFNIQEAEERPERAKSRGKRPRVADDDDEIQDAPEQKDGEKSFTATAMGRYREQVEGKLNVIPLPWANLADTCPILYPRKAGIITGNPGEGKTFLAMHLCKTVKDAGLIAKYLPLEDDLAYYLQRGASISSENWEPSKRINELELDIRERYLSRLERRYGKHFEWWGDIVEENPTICDNGEIRAIDSEWVLDWAEEESDKGARLLVIDSLAQIEFDGREEWKSQATFWRRLLGIANRSNSTIIMIIHLSKTAKGDFSSIYSVEASKRFGDLAFSVIGLQQTKLENVITTYPDGLRTEQGINCILHNMKCREGTMERGARAAFRFGRKGPSFEDYGLI